MDGLQGNISRIMIDGNPVGIQGLKSVLADMTAEYRDKSDNEIINELLNRLSRKNYIPDAAKDKYGRALLREFYRHTGKFFKQEESDSLIRIKVLGPGCAQCDRLEMELFTIMSEAGIKGDVEHIRDLKEIGRHGVMGTPALVINGEVKSVGSVPPRSKLITWLKEA